MKAMNYDATDVVARLAALFLVSWALEWSWDHLVQQFSIAIPLLRYWDAVAAILFVRVVRGTLIGWGKG